MLVQGGWKVQHRRPCTWRFGDRNRVGRRFELEVEDLATYWRFARRCRERIQGADWEFGGMMMLITTVLCYRRIIIIALLVLC